MRIDPDSDLGRRLLASEVPADILSACDFVVWPFGGALTIPWGNRIRIFIPQAWVDSQQGFGYGYRHEAQHAIQIRRWGFWGYWRRHIAARIRTLSLLAEKDPVEAEAYEAERAFIEARRGD